MPDAVTIRLDRDLARRLAKISRQSGRTRSEVVRDALRQLALLQLEELRRRIAPFAEVRGYSPMTMCCATCREVCLL